MTAFGPATLRIDEAAETTRISEGIRSYLRRARRKGTVVAVSGGIDSSVVAALCVRALGPERVLALQLPESESSDETLPISSELIASLGVDSRHEDISPMLEAFGCYRRRDDAIRRVVPEY
ncbi:MAG: asparagine synthase-related protein, partial [Corynebacterium variabile]|nr:asparagine synthase-related protein [Corynebacterium variabile]